MKQCFIVLVLGYWGRGKTIKEAAENCKKQGSRNTDKTVVKLVYGDDKAEVNSMGLILYNHQWDGDKMIVESECIHIATGLTLGSLLKTS